MTNPTLFRDVTGSHLANDSQENTMDGQVVDIDLDGDLDMVLAMEFRSNKILINDGEGKLIDESSQRFPLTAHDSEDIAAADFDGDGDVDLVFVSEDDQINEFYQNNGSGLFDNKPDRIPVTGTSNAVETTDLNHDGYFDLIIGNAGQNFVLINNQGVGFLNETALRYPSNEATTQDIELGDIDNDGDLDLIEANETFNRLLINDGTGKFLDETDKRLPKLNDQTRDADFGDIDGDGDLDLYFSNVDFGGIGDPQNRLLLNDGSGYFQEVTPLLPKSDFRTVDSDFVDLNGDGHMDLLVGNRFNGMEMIAIVNDGQLGFSDQTTQVLPDFDMYPFDFQVADFNKDGIDDIYICGFRGPDKLLFGNR
jgi:hypothetical protein